MDNVYFRQQMSEIVKGLHNFKTSRGIEIIKSEGKYFDFLDSLIWYENKKLDAIRLYPKFNLMVDRIRKELKINRNAFARNIMVDKNINIESDNISDIIAKMIGLKNESENGDRRQLESIVGMLKHDYVLSEYDNAILFLKEECKVNKIDDNLLGEIKNQIINNENDDYLKIIEMNFRIPKGSKKSENDSNKIYENAARDFHKILKNSFFRYVVNRSTEYFDAMEENYLNFSDYIGGWDEFILLHDKFFNSIDKEYKHLLYKNEMLYIAHCYFILFNQEISIDTFMSIYRGYINKDQDYEKKLKRINTSLLKAIKYNKNFINFVEQVRKKLGIKCDGSVSEILNTYKRYNGYLYKYNMFNERSIDFYKAIYKIFDCCNEFLSRKNPLDYLLIYTYIVYDEELSKEVLFDFFKSGVIKFYSGEEILNNQFIKESLYAELPIYVTSEYLECMSPLIIAKVIDHYRLSREMWRQFPYSYYRNKYIYELIYSRYENRKVDKISIEEIKQIIGILNKEYPEGYKFIDSNKPAREAGKNHTDEISEIGKLEDEREFLKEAIREYKKKKKIFESSGGLR